MSKKAFIAVCSILLLVPMMVLAGAEHEHAAADVSKMSGEATTLEGVLVCKNCSLKKEFGARSECKLNGCQTSLKTTSGKFVDFLDNKYAADLFGSKYAGKKIQVTGTFFANANTIDVQSYSIDGKSKSWCKQCTAMDGCSASK